jgi:hypothetical protein
MKQHRNGVSRKLFIIALICITYFNLGCTLRFISEYDEVLDKDVTTLQQSTETFLNELSSEVGTPAAAYNANRDFYVKTDALVRTMSTRAASQPKSKIIVGEVQTLQQTFNDMQKLHELNGDKGLTLPNISNTRSALESEFTSVLTLELALKAHKGVPGGAFAPARGQ